MVKYKQNIYWELKTNINRRNMKKETKTKKETKVKKTKKIETKTTKKHTSKKNENKVKIAEKVQYFGHKDNEDIYDSFLTNKMFAHRGLWDKNSPENSLSAFQKAIGKGYCIELDVNPIEDGTPVVFHDSKMSRMTNKDRYIQNLSREELETTTLLDTNEKIPTLEETLKFVKGRVPLLIEIKSQEKIGELEKRVLELLKNYKGEYAIQSFNPYTLAWFHDNAPKIWRGQLSSFFKNVKLGFFKKSILKRLGMKKLSKFNFVSYDIKNIPNRFTKKLEVPLLTWTVRNQEDYIKAIQYADNVIFEGFEPKI